MTLKIFYRRILPVLFIFMFSAGLMAQEKLEINLEEALNYAIDHNKTMQNAGLATLESQAALRAAITQGLPQVDAKIDYQNFFNSEASIGPMVFTFNPTSNLNLSVGQLLFSGSYIVGIQMSMLAREMSHINLKKTDAEIRTQVMKSYYLVLVSERSKQILEQNVKNLEEVIRKTSALVSTGILDETDGDQLLLQKTMLANSIKSAERQLEMAKNLMRLQLGVTASTELVLTDDLNSLMLKAAPGRSLQSAFALDQNNDFQLMMLQRDLAQKKLTMEKTRFLPTMAGFYNYTEKIKQAELDFAPKHVIGFNISIPLFSSGTRYLEHSKAKIQLHAANNQLEMVSDQLIIQEKQLRFNLQSAIEQYDAQQENINIARRVFDNVNRKYQQGVASGLDLTTANSNLLQAENAYLMAMMQVLDAQTELNKLMNQLPK